MKSCLSSFLTFTTLDFTHQKVLPSGFVGARRDARGGHFFRRFLGATGKERAQIPRRIPDPRSIWYCSARPPHRSFVVRRSQCRACNIHRRVARQQHCRAIGSHGGFGRMPPPHLAYLALIPACLAFTVACHHRAGALFGSWMSMAQASALHELQLPCHSLTANWPGLFLPGSREG